MGRYGYLDMPADYSDVAGDLVIVTGRCPICRERHTITTTAENLGGMLQDTTGLYEPDDLFAHQGCEEAQTGVATMTDTELAAYHRICLMGLRCLSSAATRERNRRHAVITGQLLKARGLV